MCTTDGMMPPLFVRPLTDAERQQLEAGLRSSDAFTLRRCQILLASVRGERAPRIAHHLRCHEQTVRNAIRAFNRLGLSCLNKGPSRPHTIHAAFPGEKPNNCGPCCTRVPVPSTSPPICGLWNWPPK